MKTTDSVRRVNIFGCPFDAISFDQTVSAMRSAVLEKSRLQIVPGSVDSVMKAKRDQAFANELSAADLVVADGVPIVWAASALGSPLRGRVSGTELVWQCAALSSELSCPVALLGGVGDVAQRAAAQMRRRFPGAILHPLATPYPLGHEESLELAKRVRALKAQIVLLALGAPRQERWIQGYLGLCASAVGIGIGSAFDIISGDKPRAPRWMRDNGLEWFHRMLQEPKRLGKRYLVEDSPFFLHLAAAVLRQKVANRSASNG